MSSGWRAHVLAGLGLALVLGLSQMKLLLGPFELGGDSRAESLSHYFYLQTCVQNGIFPLWNPLELFGTSFASNPQTMQFHPLILALAHWVGFSVHTLAVVYAIILWIAAAGFYRLCLELGISRKSSATAGIVFALCGIFSGHSMHFVYIQAFAWFPWMGVALWMSRRHRDEGGGARGQIAPWALYSIALGLALLGGYPFTVWMMVTSLGCMALLSTRDVRQLVRDGLFLAIGTLTAGGFAGVLLVPLFEAGPYMARSSESLTYLVANASQAFSPRTWLTALAPGLNLLPENINSEALLDYRSLFGSDVTMRDLHLGILPLALVFWALRSSIRKSFLPFFVLGVGALLLAFGSHSAFHEWLYYLVPPADHFRHASTFRFVTLFAASLGSAWGLDFLSSATQVQKASAGTWFLRCAALAGLLSWIGSAASLSMADQITVARTGWNLWTEEMLLNAIFLALFGLALRGAMDLPPFVRRWSLVLLVLLSALDQYHRAIEPAIGLKAFPPGAIRSAQISHQERVADYAAWADGLGEDWTPKRPIYEGNRRFARFERHFNLAGVYRFEPTLDGYEPWLPKRSMYLTPSGEFGAEGSLLGSRLFHPYLAWECVPAVGKRLRQINFQATLLLEQEVCAKAGLASSAPDAPTLIEPLRFERRQGLHVHETPGVTLKGATSQPMGFVETLELSPPRPGLQATISFFLKTPPRAIVSILSGVAGGRAFGERQDFLTPARPDGSVYHVWLGSASGRARILPAHEKGSRFELRPGMVEWRETGALKDPWLAPNELGVELDMPRPGLLLATIPAVSGWSATVNGKPAAILRAFGAFSAVEVGQGRSEVRLQYEPAAFKIGLLVSGLTWLLLLLALLGSLFARGRGPSRSTPG